MEDTDLLAFVTTRTGIKWKTPESGLTDEAREKLTTVVKLRKDAHPRILQAAVADLTTVLEFE